jgi:hypothetical protein
MEKQATLLLDDLTMSVTPAATARARRASVAGGKAQV